MQQPQKRRKVFLFIMGIMVGATLLLLLYSYMQPDLSVEVEQIREEIIQSVEQNIISQEDDFSVKDEDISKISTADSRLVEPETSEKDEVVLKKEESDSTHGSLKEDHEENISENDAIPEAVMKTSEEDTGHESIKEQVQSRTHPKEISKNLEDNSEEDETAEENEAILKIGETESGHELLKKGSEWVPSVLADHVNDTDHKLNGSCANYAKPFELKFSNVMWQVQIMPHETYFLFNAYYDNRTALNGAGPFVRVLGVTDKLDPSDQLFCQLWYPKKEEPIISNVTQTEYLWYKYWGNELAPYQPYIFSCAVPNLPRTVPESVSLVPNPCENATNNLRVIDNRPVLGKKLNFAICVKALNFKHQPIVSVKLVEWIELHRLLGADKIIFYNLHVHSNTTRVLDYFKTQGIVDIVKLTMPGSAPNIPDLMSIYLSSKIWAVQNLIDLIQYTDCLLRNMNLYEFIVVVDIDEVILPLKVLTWYELIYKVIIPKNARFVKPYVAAIVAQNVHFMDDTDEYQDWTQGIPKYMHMLQNVHRNVSHTTPGEAIKCFHNTDYVLAIHNHFPRLCIGDCHLIDFSVEDAQMQHYCIGRHKPECRLKRGKNLTVDTSIWRYKDQLIPATQKALREIGFLGNE